jgi:L-ascorbate metabolism protein UlaG (beta-lactamase superfamily)
MQPSPVRIVYVGHATVLVEMEGTKVLTDPLLRRRFMHLMRTEDVNTEALEDVDLVLVSHLHFDHLDFPSLKRLGREQAMVVPRGAGDFVRRAGFAEVRELGVGEELNAGPLTLRATPARHDPRRRPFGARAEALGYVISTSRSVYFAGDTDLFEGMAEIGPVDVALLPISGWGPRLEAGHLNPRTAAEAARLLGASVVVPIHWGTYVPINAPDRRHPPFADWPAEQFTTFMASASPEIEVCVLRPGGEAVV